MAEVDETRVSESMDRETTVCVELVGSDDVEITKSETTEREIEVTDDHDSDKLEETDGTLILAKSEDDTSLISYGRIKVSHNVQQLVARYEIADKRYDTSKWWDVNGTGKRNEGYIAASLVAGRVKGCISTRFHGISGYKYEVRKFNVVPPPKESAPIRDYFLKILIGAPHHNYIFALVHVHETDGHRPILDQEYLKSSPQ